MPKQNTKAEATFECSDEGYGSEARVEGVNRNRSLIFYWPCGESIRLPRARVAYALAALSADVRGLLSYPDPPVRTTGVKLAVVVRLTVTGRDTPINVKRDGEWLAADLADEGFYVRAAKWASFQRATEKVLSA